MKRVRFDLSSAEPKRMMLNILFRRSMAHHHKKAPLRAKFMHLSAALVTGSCLLIFYGQFLLLGRCEGRGEDCFEAAEAAERSKRHTGAGFANGHTR